MPQNKEEVVLARRQQVATLYLSGHYQTEIGRLVGVSQTQISADLKALRTQWQASSLRDFDASKALELDKIDRLEAVYMDGWQRSQMDRVQTLAEVTHGEKPSRKASVRREGQVGDPRFLDGVLSCIEKRCKILGLWKEQVEHSGEIGVVRLPSKAPTPEAWQQELIVAPVAEVN